MSEIITKTIVLRFENRFTKTTVLTVSMPYIPFKSTTGFYSRMYTGIRKSIAQGYETSLIKGRHYFNTVKSNRLVITTGNGVSLDMPYDVTPKDEKIIGLYLEAIKLSVSK